METRDAERLGNALTQMARELADTRREVLMLKRENAALRAELEHDSAATPERASADDEQERHAA